MASLWSSSTVLFQWIPIAFQHRLENSQLKKRWSMSSQLSVQRMQRESLFSTFRLLRCSMVFVLSLSTKINQPKNLTLGVHLECQSQVKAGWHRVVGRLADKTFWRNINCCPIETSRCLPTQGRIEWFAASLEALEIHRRPALKVANERWSPTQIVPKYVWRKLWRPWWMKRDVENLVTGLYPTKCHPRREQSSHHPKNSELFLCREC